MLENSIDSNGSFEKIKEGQLWPYLVALVCGAIASLLILDPLFVVFMILAPLPVLYYSLTGCLKRSVQLGLIFGFSSMLPLVIKMTKIIPLPATMGFLVLFTLLIALQFILTRLVLGRLKTHGDDKYLMLVPWGYAIVTAAITLAYNLPIAGHWLPMLTFQSFDWSRQLVSVAGSFTFMFVTSLVAGSALLLVLNRSRRALMSSAAAALVVCIMFIAGYSQAPEIDRNVRVAAITTILPEEVSSSWFSSFPPTLKTNDWLPIYHRYANLTQDAAGKGAKIIAWPEFSLMIKDDTDEANLKASLTALSKDLGVTIIAGFVNVEAARNTLFGITPSGENTTYFKHFLVPDIESSWLKPGVPNFGMLHVKELDLNIGMRTCYDNDFPIGTREAIQAGADIMVTPYADWEGIRKGHARLNASHAAENHISTLRPSLDGLSTIVGPEGEFIQSGRSDLNQDQILIDDMPISKPGTLYTKFGDWLGWLSLMLLIVMSVVRYRSSKT